MALFDPCMEFEIFLGQMASFEALLKCHSLTISKIPQRILKILFVYGFYEFLAMLEGKIGEAPFFKLQSGKMTV